MSQERQIAALEARIRLLERREPPLAGVFLDTASSPTDELRVIAPGWDDGEHSFGPVRWSPMGGVLPDAGDECVIVERDDGVWHVIGWTSDGQGAEQHVAGAFVGQIAPSALSSAASGWMLCDGSPATSAHPELRAALIADGSPFGTSGGNPRVPNLNGSFPLGANGSHALGSTGGEETHVLTTPEIPSHTHPQNQSTSASGGTQLVGASAGGSGATANGTTGATGGGGAHNNMPPFVTVKYVIYAGS